MLKVLVGGRKFVCIEGQGTFSKVFGIKSLGLTQNQSHTLARSLTVSKNYDNSSINQKETRNSSKIGQFVRAVNTQPKFTEISGDTYPFYANMSSKHLGTGSTRPENVEGLVRIYSMKFCPYAQRALLVADAKGIPHDVVNVNLKRKPQWLLDRNPAGKVPTIDTPKGSLYESLIVSDYLDEVFPANPLNPTDSYKKALDRIWVENFSKVTTLFYKTLTNHSDLEVAKGHLKDLIETLGTFEKELARRGTLYFGSADKPGMLDYMIWPWIERIPVFKLVLPTLQDYEESKKSNPNLEKWRQAMKQDPAVKANFLTPEIHLQFFKTFWGGDEPNYDLLEN